MASETEEKKAISRIKRSLIARITGPIKKVDLLKDFTGDEKKHADKALQKLVHDRKILIYKEGSRLIVSPFSEEKAMAIRKQIFMESELFKTSFFTEQFAEMHQLWEQRARKLRAKEVTVHEIDEEHQIGLINDYYVDLCHCECMDFQKRAMPCKHMYRLAHELGIMPMPAPPPDFEYDIQKVEPDAAPPIKPERQKTGCLPVLLLAILVISLLCFRF